MVFRLQVIYQECMLACVGLASSEPCQMMPSVCERESESCGEQINLITIVYFFVITKSVTHENL